MSEELKAYKPYANRDGDMFIYHKGDEDLMLDDEDELYLKTDVDAIIAQKDFEIDRLKEFNAFLKQRISNGDVGCSILLDDLEQKDKEIAKLKSRHKYKLCLDKAKLCEAEVNNIRRTPLCDMDEHEGWQHDDEFWQRWHRRWLELAEKFKEAK